MLQNKAFTYCVYSSTCMCVYSSRVINSYGRTLLASSLFLSLFVHLFIETSFKHVNHYLSLSPLLPPPLFSLSLSYSPSLSLLTPDGLGGQCVVCFIGRNKCVLIFNSALSRAGSPSPTSGPQELLRSLSSLAEIEKRLRNLWNFLNS